MQEEGKEVQRRPVLSRQFSRVGSSRLREVPVDGGGDQMTLAMAFATEKLELSPLPSAAVVPSRTLSDVIKDEDDPRRLAPGGGHRGVSWKAFKDRLKLRRSTAAWSASSSSSSGYGMAVAPGSPRPVSILEGPSTLLIPNFTATIQRTSQTTEAEAERDEVSEQSIEQEDGPMKVSLMALLEQQERSGPSFAAAVMGLVKDEEEEVEEEHGEQATTAEGKKEMLVCCVCMVRHKGAAFIPCGHTFCRLCSRELWASRGNCPLCNGYIREILDIF